MTNDVVNHGRPDIVLRTGAPVVPALIASCSERAATRYIEFFSAMKAAALRKAARITLMECAMRVAVLSC